MADRPRDPFLIDASSSDSDVEELPSRRRTTATPASSKKRHKTAPLEMPSNHPVSAYRPVVKGSGRKARDPRFDELCGDLNARVFSESYRFLNGDREAEVAALKKSMKKCRSKASKATVQSSLDMLLKSRDVDEREARIREQRADWYKEERQRVKDGKKPFFLKKSELRKIELIDKFKALQKSGSVDKFLAKRRKRNAAKDHRWLAHE